METSPPPPASAPNPFVWRIPARFNMAEAVCDRHARATPAAPALIDEGPDDTIRACSFLQMQRLANRFANTLGHLGVARGDRVMVILGQAPETAAVHVGCWKAGVISVPTSLMFGPDALEYRIGHCGVRLVVTNAATLPKLAAIRGRLPGLHDILLIDGAADGAQDFHALLDRASDAYATADTAAEDPAFISYTSGTTGPPKGTVHAHRVLLGHLPGFETLFNGFPHDGDIMWSPADWAWMGGLFTVMMPSWYHGRPVVIHRGGKFDPEAELAQMGRHGVRTSMLTPTMLKLMRQVPGPWSRFSLQLRTIITGTEAVGRDLLEWCGEALGTEVNEGFGQTECNVCIGNSRLGARIGALGRALPGHEATVTDDEGRVLPPGETGNLVLRRGDPVMFLSYWQDEAATARKYVGDWMLTGDLAQRDEDGFLWFVGRGDDVITSAGYRIGPGEIEDALIRHPAVQMAAVVGVPDPVRTEIIKAYIVLAAGHAPSDGLAEDIRQSVRARLSSHEYPREIAFIEQMPLTTTGKIMRRVLREQARAEAAARGSP